MSPQHELQPPKQATISIMAILLERYTVGPLQENCYLLADTEAREAVLIDPGDEAPRLLGALEEHQLELKAIWLTHAHFDHVGALADIKDAHEVPVHLHPADEPLLEHAADAAAMWDIPLRQPTTDFVPLGEHERLQLGNLNVTCLFTPGHAPGHIAFYLPDEALVIAGDALFKGSIGRTDLPLGNHQQLLDSIKTQLLTLPPETKVYPGHGPETTIEEEARLNPFLK